MKFLKPLLLPVIILSIVWAAPCNAQANEITEQMRCSLYLSNKSEDSIASSFAVLFNRIQVLKGEAPQLETDIASIKKALYDSNSFLKDSFTYNKLKVKAQNTKLTKTGLNELLEKHPEGIVAISGDSAVLITEYNSDTDVFFCVDPHITSPYGEIPLENTKIKFLNKIDKYYIYTSSNLDGKVIFEIPQTADTASIIYHDGDTAIYDVQTEAVAKPFYLSLKTPQRKGLRFLGWADSATSTEVSYTPGDIYTLYGDINLYAVYENEETQHRKQSYTINYYSDEVLIHTQTADGIGFVKTAPTVTLPKKDGYTFLGWRSNFYGENMLYPAYEPFCLCADMNFYAVWRKNGSFNIAYSAIHANNIPYTQSESGTTATLSAITPQKDGYIFKGWQTSDGKTLKPSQEITLTKNIMLYAFFEKGNAAIKLETQKPDYNTDEPVRLSFNEISDSGATYEVTVTNLESNTKTLFEVKSSFEYTLPAGQYTAYVTAHYTYGTYVSNKVNFAVWAEKSPSQPIEVYADGKKISFDTEPIIQNGVTLVPLRAIMEAFDAQVFWNQETRTVTTACGINVLKFTVDKGVYYKNGEQKTVTAPPQIINGRTLIPLRALAEGFDYAVHWQENTSNIYIYSQNYGIIAENVYYITDDKNPLANCDIWVIKCVNESFGLYEIRSFYDGTYLAATDRSVADGARVSALHSGEYLSALWIFEKTDGGYYIKNAENENLYLNNPDGNTALSENKHLFKILQLSQ